MAASRVSGQAKGLNGHTTPIAVKPTIGDRLKRLKLLFCMVKPVPKEWLQQVGNQKITTPIGSDDNSNALPIQSCEDYGELVSAWQDAAEWSTGLNSALTVMLASAMSTQFVGEQLWFKIIGPASTYKTSLMEGLATARKWYFSRDTIRGFHSGMKNGDNPGDVPLADLVMGKTLGTKDGDTLLKAPNLQQILSEARALYDKVSRTNYRNFVNREYMGHRMTWHLAGTSAIREIDDTELGARFLDVVIMDEITDEFEDRVNRRAARQEALNMTFVSDGDPKTQYPEALAKAMSMSGGYLDFLRTNSLELTKSIDVCDRCLDRCGHFGKFVAYMRARPSRNESVEREFSPRLVKQLTRLMISTAATLTKTKVDCEVMAVVHKVMLDTSKGFTLELVKYLAPRRQGAELRGLATMFHTSDEKLWKHFRFLRRIGVLETDVNHKRWRVTPKLWKLYEEVKNA